MNFSRIAACARQLGRRVVAQRAAIGFRAAAQRGERIVVLLQIFVFLGECEAGGNDQVEPTRFAAQPLFEIGDVISLGGLRAKSRSQMQRTRMKRLDAQQRRQVFLGVVDAVDVKLRARDVGEQLWVLRKTLERLEQPDARTLGVLAVAQYLRQRAVLRRIRIETACCASALPHALLRGGADRTAVPLSAARPERDAASSGGTASR